MAFDYPAVDSDYYTDDDKEKYPGLGYAPVTAAPAAAASSAAASPYPPVQSAAPAVGSPDDLEARAARPKTAIQDEAPPPVTPRPQWKDYAPAEPHGWAKFGHVMAALNPATNEIFNVDPERRAEEKYKNAVGEYEAPAAEEKTKAETEQKESQAENERSEARARDNPRPKPATNDFELWAQQNPDKPVGEWLKLQNESKPDKPDTATQNKENFQHGIGVLRGEGLIGASDVTDFKKIAAAVNNSKSLTPEEKNSMVGYMGANPTPSTNLQVHITGQQEGNALAEDKMFTGKEVVVHGADGSRRQMSYGDAKKAGIPLDQMTILNANEAQQNRDKDASITATMASLKGYRNDFKTIAPKLTQTDRNAMRVLTDHAQGGQMAGLLGNLFDDIPLAGPMAEYGNKLMRGTMTSDQYNQLSPEGKKLVADYFSQLVANFANMKAVLGSMGRNPAQIQAEINRVPLPYLDWNSANELFNRTRDDIRTRAGSLPQLR